MIFIWSLVRVGHWSHLRLLNESQLQVVKGASHAVIINAREFHLLGESCCTAEGLQGRRPGRKAVRVWV